MKRAGAVALCLLLAGCGDIHHWDAVLGPVPGGTHTVEAGAGLLVNDHGSILTVAHMIDHCSEIRVAGQSIPPQQAKLIALAGPENIGLAILQIDQKNTPSVTLSPSWNGYTGVPKIAGFPLTIAGYPHENLTLTPSHVEASGLATIFMRMVGTGHSQTIENVSPQPGWPGWSLNVQSGPGYSGGAVFDPAHNIIGIVLGGDSEWTIAHPSDDMLAYLAGHGVEASTRRRSENDYGAVVRVSCYST